MRHHHRRAYTSGYTATTKRKAPAEVSSRNHAGVSHLRIIMLHLEFPTESSKETALK